MTVHGAKGLEAPIVILPDTTYASAAARLAAAARPADGGFLWAPRKADDCAASAAARERARARRPSTRACACSMSP